MLLWHTRPSHATNANPHKKGGRLIFATPYKGFARIRRPPLVY
ncbi:hypothetical protein GCWU000325_00605 [Alloprevotella tannerae ATCC 51259]|uniref:Uncharacterized protein n=1 Tax=Alloprevotella tannerae ATCC 51259 TaxID=626522 RepID=C9LEH9_9BACT|nr:hypothetical protein GCWU000325_00605 [Alloprevotella tannerae ATCC 51259]